MNNSVTITHIHMLHDTYVYNIIIRTTHYVRLTAYRHNNINTHIIVRPMPSIHHVLN